MGLGQPGHGGRGRAAGVASPAEILGAAGRSAQRDVAELILRASEDEYPPAKLRLGVVTAVDDDTMTATVSVGGGNPIPGVASSSEYDPEVGDTVSLLQAGPVYLILAGVANVNGRGALRFEADDFHVLTAAEVAAGSASFRLTHRPMREAVVAFMGGAPQGPAEYSIDYATKTVTWPLSGFEKAGDVIWVHYAYRKRKGLAMSAAGTASYDTNRTQITPPAASGGDLLVLAVLLSSGNAVSALNGYSELGVSATVTKAWGGGTDSYKLGVYTTVCPAGGGPIPVPSFVGAVRDSPWAMAAVTGKTVAVTNSALAIAHDAHSASTPVITDTALRVYGVLGVNPIVTAPGTTVAENVTDRTGPDDQVTIVIKIDGGNSEATVTTTDGTNRGEWMLGSIAIGASA